MFNQSIAGTSFQRGGGVHQHMAERWESFQRGLRLMIEANQAEGLDAPDAQERMRLWVQASVHRMFAGPLSAVMQHGQDASGQERKRYAEMSDVLRRLFSHEVSSVLPLGEPEEMQTGAWRNASTEEVLRVVKTSKCFRCDRPDPSGDHFTCICGATADVQGNQLTFNAMARSGPSRVGAMRGAAASRADAAGREDALLAENDSLRAQVNRLSSSRPARADVEPDGHRRVTFHSPQHRDQWGYARGRERSRERDGRNQAPQQQQRQRRN